MSTKLKTSDVFFIGVDGGGSKCKVVLTNGDGKILAVTVAGPANPYQDASRARQSVNNAIQAVLQLAGMDEKKPPHLVVGMGLAGANIEAAMLETRRWSLPCNTHFVTTDLHIAALAAHGGEDGAVVVIGTGSSAYSHVNQTSVYLGGHGFPLGDIGSGAWIGLSALQAVLLATDKLGPSTRLSDRVSETLQATGLTLVAKFAGATQSDYAALAPIVFATAAEGDTVALGIINRGAEYLSDLMQQLIDKGAPRVSIIGGLAKVMFPYLRPQVSRQLQPALEAPEIGAVLFARKRFAASQVN